MFADPVNKCFPFNSEAWMINNCMRREGEIGNFCLREKIKAHLPCSSGNEASGGGIDPENVQSM